MMSFDPVTTPPDLDRLIQEVLATLGFSADAAEVARRVRRLNYGLPAEDEFAVMCAWLGQLRLLHKLDQQQVPLDSRSLYQVPDLLAVFGPSGPVLIEVKVANSVTLSFKPDYHARLKAYAETLNLPLLIAWKFHSIWTLFDARSLKLARVNYNITFNEAMRQNLLGVLAGDVGFTLAAGAGIHFEMAKEKLLETSQDGDEHTETWQMRMRDVYFTVGGGERRKDLHPESVELFATWNLEERQSHAPARIVQSFEARGGIEFAHRALVHLLHWRGGEIGPEKWRALLRAPQVTRNIQSFSTALDRALSEGVVSHIFHQQPVTQPEFLARARPDT